jgi:DNA-binding MarR family transcriptional regulator
VADEQRIRRALAPAVTARRLYGTTRLPVPVAGSGPAARPITPLQMQTLLGVALEPEATSDQLAETLAVPAATLRDVLLDLDRDGLLQSTPTEHDARLRRREPTRAAWRAIDRFLGWTDQALLDVGSP